MSKEFAHYKLKASNRPAESPALSTTVAVRGEDGLPYYCYASFSDKLVQYVGKKLPQGVSSFSPAYLSVFFNKRREVWEVWVSYVDSDTLDPTANVKLWETAGKAAPSWLSFYKVKSTKEP